MVQDVNMTTKFRTDAILKTARFNDAILVAILTKDRPVRRLFGWKTRHCTHSWTVRFGDKVGINSTKECFKINIISWQPSCELLLDTEGFPSRLQNSRKKKNRSKFLKCGRSVLHSFKIFPETATW